MPAITRGVLDDNLPTVAVKDYSGGLNTMDGILSLSSNETFDCLNMLGFPGRGLYIGGTNLVTPLITGTADGGIQFYDADNSKHEIVWENGNMYDTVGGTRTTIAGNVYTAGQNIGRTVLNSILYWSTLSVPMRQYDGTTEKAVAMGTATGNVAIPASDYLCTYAGSIIAANPTIGTQLNPGSIIPSNTNDPKNFIGANQATIGNNNPLKALVPMSVAAGGIPPTSSVLCVGSVGLVLAQGAVNAFKLQNVNYPIGCKDGNSVVYIPTGDLLGNVVYLGTDNQFHETNGITTKMISGKIMNLMNRLIYASVGLNANQRFSGTYNKTYHYYLCDLGQDTQLIYKWTRMADESLRTGWFKAAWPSGMYMDGTSGVGLPTNYVAVNNTTDAAGLYEVGLDGTNFNGVQPSIYYQIPYLHANDDSEMKEWQWCNLSFNNARIGAYTVTPTGYTNASNTTVVGNPITFTAPQNVPPPGGQWDVAQWDAANWAADPSTPAIQQPAINSKMLTGSFTDALGNTVNGPLRSSAMSFKIAWSAINSKSTPVFDITQFKTRYKPMGHYMTGGATGSAEAS